MVVILQLFLFLSSLSCDVAISFYEPSIEYPSFSFQNITISDRHLYLNSSSPSIPCGYMIPTDLDMIKLYYSQPQYDQNKCSIAIIRLLFGGYEIFTFESRKYRLFQPKQLKGHHLCYILITDLQSLQIPEISESIFPRASPYPWTVYVINNLVDSNPAKTMKIIKLSLFRLFPLAKYILYYDVKYHLKGNPVTFIEECEREMQSLNVSFSIYRPRVNSTVITSFYAALQRLKFLNNRYGVVHNLSQEIKDIYNQMAMYRKEGFLQEVKGKEDLMIDSAIIVFKNEDLTHRFFCAWLNEMMLFSRRDQLSFAYLEWKLKITGFKYPPTLQRKFFNKCEHKYPSLQNTSLIFQTNQNKTKTKTAPRLKRNHSKTG
jgi:hypothetical protein